MNEKEYNKIIENIEKEKKVLRLLDPTIHLRISGDGRNVGQDPAYF